MERDSHRKASMSDVCAKINNSWKKDNKQKRAKEHKKRTLKEKRK